MGVEGLRRGARLRVCSSRFGSGVWALGLRGLLFPGRRFRPEGRSTEDLGLKLQPPGIKTKLGSQGVFGRQRSQMFGIGRVPKKP